MWRAKAARVMDCGTQLRACINTDNEGGHYVCTTHTIIDGKLVSRLISKTFSHYDSTTIVQGSIG